MSGTTIKKCKNCDHQVEPTYTGACPNCGEKAGYSVTVQLTEVVTVGDVIQSYQKSMKDAIEDAFKKYDGLEKKFKDNETALNKLNVLRKSLKSEEAELMKKAEKDAREKTTKTKTFTIGAIIGTEEQRKEHIEKNVKSEIKAESERSVKNLMEEFILGQALIGTQIQKIHDRLSPSQTILFGLGIGVLGSIIGGIFVLIMTGNAPEFIISIVNDILN